MYRLSPCERALSFCFAVRRSKPDASMQHKFWRLDPSLHLWTDACAVRFFCFLFGTGHEQHKIAFMSVDCDWYKLAIC